MKSLFSYSLLAAVAASGMVSAQTPMTATTPPVGYSTTNLGVGFNALGLTLQSPALAAGNFEAVSGTTATDTGLTFTPIAGRIYVLEITSGSTQKGVIAEVGSAGIVGTSLTAADNLQALGVTAGDTYKLRVAPTLEEIFTTTPLASGGILQAALGSSSADIVWVPDGNGGYTQYFLHTTGQFRLAGTSTPAVNVPVVYSDGFYVQKKSAGIASLTVSGEVKTVGTDSQLVSGFNLLGSVAPVGLNLFNAGIENSVQPALSSLSADLVWVQQSDLNYKKYFRHTTGGWREDGTSVNLTQAQAEAVVLSSGFLVQRKTNTAPSQLKLKVPASYSSL